MKPKLVEMMTTVERRYKVTLAEIRELMGADTGEEVYAYITGSDGACLYLNDDRVMYILVRSKVKGN